MASLSEALGKKKTQVLKVRPGTYDSVVVSADYSPIHQRGKAIVIGYELTSASGKKYHHKEYFYRKYNERTEMFKEYLAANGIDPSDIETFIGCCEKVDIRKSTDGPFMTIDHREFVSKPVSENA